MIFAQKDAVQPIYYNFTDFPNEEEFIRCIQDIDSKVKDQVQDDEDIKPNLDLQFNYDDENEVSAHLLQKDKVEPEKEKPAKDEGTRGDDTGKLETKNTDMDFLDEEQSNFEKPAEKQQVELKFKLQFIYIINFIFRRNI